ncbi:MAG: MFS transporter [Dehalococcoidia bacterium]|nr:MFS transporter [Dehalococcoidia bacterium]
MLDPGAEKQRKRPAFLDWDPVRYFPYYFMFFLWFIGSGAQVLARPLFAGELGATPFLVVLITASNGLAHMVSSPITGFLTDRVGRRPLLLAGTLIRAGTLAGQFFATSYWAFFGLEFIGGIGIAMWQTSATIAMADITTVENRGRLLALRQMTSRLGNLIGPAAAALVIRAFNDELKYVFLLNGASKVLVFFLLLYLAKETAPELNRLRHQAGEKLEKLDLSFFLTRGFMALFITTLSLNMMGQGGAFGALFPVQAREQVGLSSAQLGELLSLAGFIGLLVTIPSGWVIDKYGRKVTLIPGLVLLAAGAFVLTSLDNMTQVYLVITLYGLGQAMSMGASQAFAADLAPDDRRGAFLGRLDHDRQRRLHHRAATDRRHRDQLRLRARLRHGRDLPPGQRPVHGPLRPRDRRAQPQPRGSRGPRQPLEASGRPRPGCTIEPPGGSRYDRHSPRHGAAFFSGVQRWRRAITWPWSARRGSSGRSCCASSPRAPSPCAPYA